MSRKNTLKYPVLTAQNLASTFTSPVTFIRNTDNVSYQIIVTTTNSVGTFSVEVSDDYAPEVGNLGTWSALTLANSSGATTPPSVAAANDTIIISLNQLPFDAIRLVYTSVTPGTGVASATLTSKQIGG